MFYLALEFGKAHSSAADCGTADMLSFATGLTLKNSKIRMTVMRLRLKRGSRHLARTVHPHPPPLTIWAMPKKSCFFRCGFPCDTSWAGHLHSWDTGCSVICHILWEPLWPSLSCHGGMTCQLKKTWGPDGHQCQWTDKSCHRCLDRLGKKLRVAASANNCNRFPTRLLQAHSTPKYECGVASKNVANKSFVSF